MNAREAERERERTVRNLECKGGNGGSEGRKAGSLGNRNK